MTSRDLDTIIRDLNKRFAAPLLEFYKRRIIFWYDEDREFEDKLDNIQIDSAKQAIIWSSQMKQVCRCRKKRSFRLTLHLR